MSSTFDLTAAKSLAAAKRTADLNESAGAASNALDAFLVKVAESTDLSDLEKVAFFAMVEGNAKGLFESLVSGSPTTPRVLGAGTRPGNPDDPRDQLLAAESENGVLKTNQNTLKRAVEVVLGSSIPMVDGAVPASTVRDVQARIAQIKTEAAAAVGSADYVRKDAVKPLVEEAKRLIGNVSADFVGKKVIGQKPVTDKLDEAIRLLVS